MALAKGGHGQCEAGGAAEEGTNLIRETPGPQIGRSAMENGQNLDSLLSRMRCGVKFN